ncbi:unnamed protein product, partial [Tetraodon nigroviridis]
GTVPDQRGLFQRGQISVGAGGQVQAEPGDGAERGAAAERLRHETSGRHQGHRQEDRRRLCGTAGQAGAAVPDRPEPRNQAELPEDGVSERGLLVSRTSTSRMKEDLKLGSS